MFDYISAIYYSESFGSDSPSPLDAPADQTEHELLRQLDRVAAEMGGVFAARLSRNLRIILNGRQLDAYRAGICTGGQLTASILADPQ